MVTLDNMVRADLINLDMKAETKEQVIEELSELLCFWNMIGDSAVFKDAVLSGNSGMKDNKGNGIVLAYGASETVKRAVLAVGRLAKGISWEDYGEAVDIVAILAVPMDDIDVEKLNVRDLVGDMLDDIMVVSDLYNLQSSEGIANTLKKYLDEV